MVAKLSAKIEEHKKATDEIETKTKHITDLQEEHAKQKSQFESERNDIKSNLDEANKELSDNRENCLILKREN